MSNAREAQLRGEIDFTRQRGWFDPSQSDATVTMVGCGGIGSVTAMALAKLGIPKLVLIDGDTVEAHNLPNQMFYLGDKGKPKVDAVGELAQDIGITEVESYFGFLTEKGIESSDPALESYRPSGIVVSGLDSMEARQEVWKTIRYNINVPFYIDARLGGESVVLYCVDPRKPDECRRYEETLHSSSESVEAPCTMRSIIDVGFIVSSLIVRAVRRHIAGEPPEHTVFWNHKTLNASVGR